MSSEACVPCSREWCTHAINNNSPVSGEGERESGGGGVRTQWYPIIIISTGVHTTDWRLNYMPANADGSGGGGGGK